MPCTECRIAPKTAITQTIVWGTILLVGVLLVALRSNLMELVLVTNLAIVPDNLVFPNWQDYPVPILTSIYFFNVTNADDVQQRGAKPVLVEVGPYVFREYHHKTNLEWNDGNLTVTYQQIRTYQFDANRTKGSLDDVIVTLNAPAASANAIAATVKPFTQGLINIGLKVIGEKLFVAQPVRKLLFEGYKDPILTDTQFLPPSIIPQKMDKFGYFYGRNGSVWYDGVFNMYTGQGNLSQLGQVYTWNYTHHLPY